MAHLVRWFSELQDGDFHSKLLVNQRVYTWPVHDVDVDFTTVNDWIYHVDVCMLMLSVYMMSKSDTYITKYVNTITVSTHITSHKNTSCIWYYTTRMCIYLYILYSKPKKCQKCTILLLLNTDQSLPYLFGGLLFISVQENPLVDDCRVS